MTADYRFGRFELRPASRQLLLEGNPIAVGARAFDVLLALIERRERLVTKDELLDLAWPGLVVEENNLQVQISSLRKMLGDEMIKTMPGRGYRFTAEAVRIAPVLQDGPRHNLPHTLTRFIGHEADLNVYEQVVAANKLVTLTGAGGCGKTRLAVELASRLLQEFAHGAWFIDLAPMTDAERLPLTVARTLNLTERPGRSMTEVLCEHLADRQMLLVLDNCEHLLTACGNLVATLLSRADRLHILATSREALGLPGEQTLRVRSLSCPPADPEPSTPFEQFEAVQLFVDRARLVRSDFGLDTVTAPAVAEICRRLDGIPLAIELAAARTKVRSISELRNMMDNRFRLLVGGSKTVPPRQQTLLATIQWSFELLTPNERQLMQRLSIFSGGWTVESAVGVAGEQAGPYEMLELLAHLVDKSLVTTDRSERDSTRYGILEIIREFGLAALNMAGELETITRRHADYFAAMAERLEPAFAEDGHQDALEQLAPEVENFVQALRRCQRLDGGSELGLRLVAALGPLWLAGGLIELGDRLTTAALSLHEEKRPSPARARALIQASRIAALFGRYEEMQDRLRECLALARALHDDNIAAAALSLHVKPALELGDIASGIKYGEESLRLARECGDPEQTCRALHNLAGAIYESGDFDRTRALFEECLRIGREEGDSHAIAYAASNLVRTYISLGEWELAWTPALEALDVSSRSKSKLTMLVSLEALAILAAAQQDWQSAARMFGVVEAAQKAVGLKLWRQDASDVFPALTVTRNALSEQDFEVAYAGGRALTMEQGVNEARAWLKRIAPARHTPG